MKDLIIKGSFIRRELYILLGCLAAAELINLGAIISYGRPASELLTMLGFVVTTGLIIYVLLALVRVLIYLVYRLFAKSRQ